MGQTFLKSTFPFSPLQWRSLDTSTSTPVCGRKDFVLNFSSISSFHPSAGGFYYHHHHQSVCQDIKALCYVNAGRGATPGPLPPATSQGWVPV